MKDSRLTANPKLGEEKNVFKETMEEMEAQNGWKEKEVAGRVSN